MNRLKLHLALLGMGAAIAAYGERDARACGGCFTPPPPPGQNVDSQITGERMIFSISPQQTTLYDEITYSGSPTSFAWVLPIKGKVDVGLSADLLFATLDQVTATTVEAPPTDCPPPPVCGTANFGAGGGGGTAGTGGGGTAPGAPPVTVIAQDQVGPYEMVQLASKDGSALTSWLSSHGYDIPASDQPAIDHYVATGMDFLALKLVPGKGVNAMQPVRVTTPGAFPVLPLRMVGVGTGPVTGITIWVVADGRWQPQNFPFFTITDDELAWDWTTNASNFTQVRDEKEKTYNGAGWQLESSIELAKFGFSNTVQQAQQQLQFSPHPTGGYTLPTASAAGDGGTGDGGTGEGGAAEGGSEGGKEEALVDEAQHDVEVLFAGVKGANARITRLRGDISHSALTSDLTVEASSDQTEVSNIYNPKKQIGQPLCPVYNSSCQSIGELPRDQARAEASGESGGGCSTTKSTPSMSDWAIGVVASLLAMAGIASRRSSRRKS